MAQMRLRSLFQACSDVRSVEGLLGFASITPPVCFQVASNSPLETAYGVNASILGVVSRSRLRNASVTKVGVIRRLYVCIASMSPDWQLIVA